MPPNTPGHRGLETFGTVEARDRGPMKLRSSGEPHLAEGVGFEPTGTEVPRLFKSRAFVRSAIPPDSSAGAIRAPELAAILPDLRAHRTNPLIRPPPRLLGFEATAHTVGACGGIGTQELDAGLIGVKISQGVGDPLLGAVVP